MARHGWAWLGLARQGKHTASSRRCGSLLGQGMARLGVAGLGKAKQGGPRKEQRRTTHLRRPSVDLSRRGHAWQG
ncbi:hypothetical protein EBZ39_13180 [bacterium]|nr:hypothetical protein [bacterium]